MEVGLCKGIQVGNGGFTILHFQFAEDTMIFSKLELDNVLNIKRVLRCFQVIFDLKINFQKSRLYGIKVEDKVHGLDGFHAW